MAEFPGHFFVVEKNTEGAEELRCSICRCVVDHSRKDSVEKHLVTQKHASLEEEKRNALTSASTLFDFGLARENVPIGSGATLSQDHKSWRVLVLHTILKAGIPLAKIDDLREILEHHSPHSLTHSSHMAKMIPGLLKSMKAKTEGLIKGRKVVILFDGTPHIGEVLSIVVRFWNGRLRQRLLSFVHLDKPPTAVDLYRVRFHGFRHRYLLSFAL